LAPGLVAFEFLANKFCLIGQDRFEPWN